MQHTIVMKGRKGSLVKVIDQRDRFKGEKKTDDSARKTSWSTALGIFARVGWTSELRTGWVSNLSGSSLHSFISPPRSAESHVVNHVNLNY